MSVDVLPVHTPAHKLIHYSLDDEPQVTTNRIMTPVKIMESAKPVPIDPATHYLVQLEGDHKVSYKGKPDEPIEMHEHAKFITVSTGPTPVSGGAALWPARILSSK
jgi:hypothetical protein